VALGLDEPPFGEFLSGRVSRLSTKLEVYTAIIGDRIFEEWCADSFAEAGLRQSGVSLRSELTLIKRDVEMAIDYDNAALITEAQRSPVRVCSVIQGHLDRLKPKFLGDTDHFNCTLLWMYVLEENLRLWVSPWFDVRLYTPYKPSQNGDKVSVQLLNPKTGQRVAGMRCAMSTLDFHRLHHARMLLQLFNRERREILEHRSTLTSQGGGYFSLLRKNMLRYRNLIETGDWSKVPVITWWSLLPFQVQSPASVCKSILQAMHSNLDWDQDCEQDLEALSADLKIVEQEQEDALSRPHPTIKRLFDQLEAQGLGYSHGPNPQAERFSRIRNSRKPKPKPVEFRASDYDNEESTISVLAMFFGPDTPLDEIVRDMLTGVYDPGPVLINAVRAGDREMARVLLERGVNTEAVNDLGLTALQIAAFRGDEGIVRLLLEYNADVHVELIGFVRTVLELAVFKGHANVVKLLLENGAEVEEGALREAVKRGDRTILQYLLDHGADLTHRYDDYDERTILHQAAAEGSLDMVKRLIDKGVDIDARDIKDWSSLHLAAVCGHQTVVQVLLDAGADINAKTCLHSTPLYVATDAKQTAVVQTLLDNQADMEIGDKGMTPLFPASINGDELSMQHLLERGANANALFINITPLHAAVVHGTPLMLELLLRHGAQADAQGTCQQGICETPLHFAAESGRTSAAEVLLKWKANVNAKYHDGQTPLHLAAAKGHLEMVSLLLKKKPDLESKDDTYHRTPLHAAGLSCRTEPQSGSQAPAIWCKVSFAA